MMHYAAWLHSETSGPLEPRGRGPYRGGGRGSNSTGSQGFMAGWRDETAGADTNMCSGSYSLVRHSERNKKRKHTTNGLPAAATVTGL